MTVTRFAPSPTGALHLGHAFSALSAFHFAKDHGGRFLLRIEDIDQNRCKPEFTQQIYEDLEWLGLEWETPVRIQSKHFDDYQNILDQLKAMGLLYPCFCTRGDIRSEIERSGAAPHGPDGPLYPGICRNLSADAQQEAMASNKPHAWRLDISKALLQLNSEALYWNDAQTGNVEAQPEMLGDVVLARKDTPTSYHLSVTHDDALQGITHIVRGQDLYFATHIHRLLQALLGYPIPHYIHHELLKSEDGVRLAKRHKSESLKSLRESGITAKDIRRRLGF